MKGGKKQKGKRGERKRKRKKKMHRAFHAWGVIWWWYGGFGYCGVGLVWCLEFMWMWKMPMPNANPLWHIDSFHSSHSSTPCFPSFFLSFENLSFFFTPPQLMTSPTTTPTLPLPLHFSWFSPKPHLLNPPFSMFPCPLLFGFLISSLGMSSFAIAFSVTALWISCVLFPVLPFLLLGIWGMALLMISAHPITWLYPIWFVFCVGRGIRGTTVS